MLPRGLEAILTAVTAIGTLYFIARLFLREKLPPRVRFGGWLAVGGTVLGFLGSLWVESLLPFLHAKRWDAIWRTLAQVGGMGVGVGFMLWGMLRFLRRFFNFLGGIYAKDVVNIRLTPSLGVRIRLVWHIISCMLRLSGLGWLLMGLGFAILTRNVFPAPDPSLHPDWTLGRVGVALMILGALQELFSCDAQEG